ncbi:hydrolase [Paenibacillus athensensis]|uniref:Hydrolase n=1 Tax=Paenibacillus athensensis TaxID=1967502 RepID=A0A4Y8PS57_9BACL|nr:hydrolase [Paenibacillus athensensis]MCD1258023.1 hydrolase [Paenibacillus athensensis]
MEALFNWETTALILIDLQKGVVGYNLAPYSGQEVVGRAAALTDAFRKRGALVGLVRVTSKDGKDMLRPKLDQELPRPVRPEGWDEITPEIGVQPSDLLITKRQWGAFHGTELDLQLRRRKIDTIVLGGIASGIGVDTTAREAFQHGYDLIFAIDAISGLSEAEHDYVRQFIFPRIGRIRTTEQILQAGEAR